MLNKIYSAENTPGSAAQPAEPPATDDLVRLVLALQHSPSDDDACAAADLIERQAREIADYKQKWIECAAERTALSAQLADGYHAAGLSHHVGILVNRAERAEAERNALRATVERQAREIADKRAMLQNTNRDAAQLAHLADKYKWQVRDTCTRAERAEDLPRRAARDARHSRTRQGGEMTALSPHFVSLSMCVSGRAWAESPNLSLCDCVAWAIERDGDPVDLPPLVVRSLEIGLRSVRRTP